MTTKIEWTNATWNPVTGCDRVSPGCAHCYALTLAKRLKAMGQPRYQRDGGRASGPGFGVTLHHDALEAPLHWKKPRRVFVNSMSDLFHEEIPDEFIDRVFAVMALTRQHTYQVLTKRPERMREYFANRGPDLEGEDEYHSLAYQYFDGEVPEWAKTFNWPLPNVWLGVTAENQRWADERIEQLLRTPAAVHFVSAEPLLGPISFTRIDAIQGPYNDWLRGEVREVNMGEEGLLARFKGLDWVIVGGESGPKHRPFNPEWARSVVAQCHDAGVACFVKQLGGARPGNRLEDLPEDLRVREFPT